MHSRGSEAAFPWVPCRLSVSHYMVNHMKTTVDLPEALVRRAKEAAARRGTTLRALVEAGLRSVLRERKRGQRFELRDARVSGRGISSEFDGAGWDRIRDAAYEGHGA